MLILPVSSPLNAEFAISRGAKTSAETVRVELHDGDQIGRGECVPYARYGESRVSVVAQLAGIETAVKEGLSRDKLQKVMPAGAARCAVDCAMWDLEAKQSGVPVWQCADLPEPKALDTTMTISLAEPATMARAAKQADAKILKLKFGSTDDIARLEAIRQARPDARLIVDGNEGMAPETFPEICDIAASLGVAMIEQPFPQGQDDSLLKRPGQISICADESVHTRQDIQALARKYDAVNIKLDKAGGLTEALAMMHEARRCGLATMVGCMVAGSLSMAPAVLLGQLADVVDLDGPLWLKEDIGHKLRYGGGTVSPPQPALWG